MDIKDDKDCPSGLPFLRQDGSSGVRFIRRDSSSLFRPILKIPCFFDWKASLSDYVNSDKFSIFEQAATYSNSDILSKSTGCPRKETHFKFSDNDIIQLDGNISLGASSLSSEDSLNAESSIPVLITSRTDSLAPG